MRIPFRLVSRVVRASVVSLSHATLTHASCTPDLDLDSPPPPFAHLLKMPPHSNSAADQPLEDNKENASPAAVIAPSKSSKLAAAHTPVVSRAAASVLEKSASGAARGLPPRTPSSKYAGTPLPHRVSAIAAVALPATPLPAPLELSVASAGHTPFKLIASPRARTTPIASLPSPMPSAQLPSASDPRDALLADVAAIASVLATRLAPWNERTEVRLPVSQLHRIAYSS